MAYVFHLRPCVAAVAPVCYNTSLVIATFSTFTFFTGRMAFQTVAKVGDAFFAVLAGDFTLGMALVAGPFL